MTALLVATCGAGASVADAAVSPTPAAITPTPTDDLAVFATVDGPRAIVEGPDGRLWYSDENRRIWAMDSGGTHTAFEDPAIEDPASLAPGADGNVWYGGPNGGIGRIAADGTAQVMSDTPVRSLTSGPDGNIWFLGVGSIGNITPAGVVATFPFDTADAVEIVSGPGGALWFTRAGAAPAIGRITTTGTIDLFPVAQEPHHIVAGPDGNLWFTTEGAFPNVFGALSRMTPAGTVTDFVDPLTHQTAEVPDLAVGPDGNLWLAGGPQVGYATTAGTFTTIPEPDAGSFVRLTRVTAGSDGNLWFTDVGANQVVRITPSGTITPMGPGVRSLQGGDLAAGPDGNLWVANCAVTRVTPTGEYTAFRDPALDCARSITAGPDGNLWVAAGVNSIGVISPTGTLIARHWSVNFCGPDEMVRGPDGNLWFSSPCNHRIGRISPTGSGAVFGHPDLWQAEHLVAGPDGNVWFTDAGDGEVGRITPAGGITMFPATAGATKRGLAVGLDGALWFSDGSHQVRRLETDGDLMTLPDVGADVGALVAGPDGNLWFTSGEDLGRLTLAGEVALFAGANLGELSALASGPGHAVWFGAWNEPSVGRMQLDPLEGAAFHPVAPVRIADSRAATQVGPFGSPWGAGVVRDVPVAGVGGVPAGADAVVLNVTATNTTASSFLSIWPAGGAQPLVSSLNWASGRTVANQVTVPVGADGEVSVFNPSGAVDVVVDVSGYYETDLGAGFTASSPSRILDSRAATQVGPFGSPWGVGTTRDVPVAGVGGVPAGADAVLLNVTVTNATASSFLSIWPTGAAQPLVSSLNWAPGRTVANQVTVPVGAGGKVSVFNPSGAVDVVADVAGWFDGGSGDRFHPVAPARVQDSRAATQVGPYATPWAAGTTRTVGLGGAGGVPVDASAVSANVTVTNTTAPSFLTVWPAGTTMPLTSRLNWAAGQTVANATTAALGGGGLVSVYNPTGAVDVIVDVSGWYG